ncbi:ATP-binding protein [Schinkia azotoformans]|uniref:histidine kinase n=1 Tax=Schinkia azotoformans LMG 9581 TaxID=1131731 RepID=K6CHZ6_SCHAZ|nr:ATP-binding protein [Schinkia azotoformans]EKN70775.1 integral membrane sensor signal transduction histidine kinase [Schinkia azotoformans LMG 9581]MEC1641109.1 ATP-binding protein [Schinkia azotoformans]MEC1947558.1 ATP-binding protein [Schinkia azotoformans]
MDLEMEINLQLNNFKNNLSNKTTFHSIITFFMEEIKNLLSINDCYMVQFHKVQKIYCIEKFISKDSLTNLYTLSQNEMVPGNCIEFNNCINFILGNKKELTFILCCEINNEINSYQRLLLNMYGSFINYKIEQMFLSLCLIDELKIYNPEKDYPSWITQFLLHLAEKERNSLEQELHDTILQEQIYLNHKIEHILSKNRDKMLVDDLAEVKELIRDNIYYLRDMCNEIRYPFLIQESIHQAIGGMFQCTELRSNIKVQYRGTDLTCELSEELKINIYRIIQELLNNAIKHSDATMVNIELFDENQKLFLNYSDNGKGMDMVEISKDTRSMGIFGIRARIKSMDGSIKFETSPGNGLKVFGIIPI